MPKLLMLSICMLVTFSCTMSMVFAQNRDRDGGDDDQKPTFTLTISNNDRKKDKEDKALFFAERGWRGRGRGNLSFIKLSHNDTSHNNQDREVRIRKIGSTNSEYEIIIADKINGEGRHGFRSGRRLLLKIIGNAQSALAYEGSRSRHSREISWKQVPMEDYGREFVLGLIDKTFEFGRSILWRHNNPQARLDEEDCLRYNLESFLEMPITCIVKERNWRND